MINVISLGAGKQSSYMLLRALNGDFGVKPDYAIFADTGCEPAYVYEFLYWLQDYASEYYNFGIKVVSVGDLMKDVEDYIDGKRSRVAQLPFFTENNGFVNRQCTGDYKIIPLRKKLQQIRNGERVRMWIGISLDEVERIKQSPVKYIEHYYPLVEHRITIDQIIKYFKDNHLPEPGKSACLICPFHSINYWRTFKQQFPSEFERACEFDDKIRNYPKLDNKCYLSKQLKPLRDIDLTPVPSLFPELIEECHGLCGL